MSRAKMKQTDSLSDRQRRRPHLQSLLGSVRIGRQRLTRRRAVCRSTFDGPSLCAQAEERPEEDDGNERDGDRQEGHDRVLQKKVRDGSDVQPNNRREASEMRYLPHPDRIAPKTTCSVERMKTKPPPVRGESSSVSRGSKRKTSEGARLTGQAEGGKRLGGRA